MRNVLQESTVRATVSAKAESKNKRSAKTNLRLPVVMPLHKQWAPINIIVYTELVQCLSGLEAQLLGLEAQLLLDLVQLLNSCKGSTHIISCQSFMGSWNRQRALASREDESQRRRAWPTRSSSGRQSASAAKGTCLLT